MSEFHELRSIIDQVLDCDVITDPRERPVRLKLLAMLFDHFGEAHEPRLRTYVIDTDGIPLDKLAVAISAAMRTHRYPSTPMLADLWRLARAAAGMDRQQYHAGRYLEMPSDWPPSGQRHGVNLGSFEALPGASMALLAGARKQLESGEES